MTQLYTDDTGQRFLPALSPYQQGQGSSAYEPNRQRDRLKLEEDKALDFQDVIELDREPGIFQPPDRLAEDRQQQSQPDNGYSFTGSGVGFSAPPASFSVDRDVVANIYASNEAVSGGVNPGGNLNLVA